MRKRGRGVEGIWILNFIKSSVINLNCISISKIRKYILCLMVEKLLPYKNKPM